MQKIPGYFLNLYTPALLSLESSHADTKLIVAGVMKPEEAAKHAQEVIEKWRARNPEDIKYFEKWYEEMGFEE